MSTDYLCTPSGELPFDPNALRERLRERAGAPTSTYRLQLHAGFTFRDALTIVPYLAQLGVGGVYCSPYLQARPGSTHGYDICDHGRLNPELGAEEDYQAFVDALHKHGMKQLLDFVPNHMAADALANPWWRDVLENGRSSPFAGFFDIDWGPLKEELRGKVLLPILGDHYGNVLERGELELAMHEGALVLHYFKTQLPTDPKQAPRVFRQPTSALDLADESDPDTREFLSILTALERLPPTSSIVAERSAERRREKEVARERLLRLMAQSARVCRHIDECLGHFKGRPGDAPSFDPLHEFLELQPYRLAYWKTAAHEINYRRFFDINELAGVHMEEPAVFQAAHRLILRLACDGKINGLRLDHLDGLFDPQGYLERLQEEVVIAHAGALLDKPPVDEKAFREAVRDWRAKERLRSPGGPSEKPLYVLAEKILTGQERLRLSWALDGASGYDFLNDLNRLFVNDAGLKLLRRGYEHFVGMPMPFEPTILECKRLIVSTAMAGEWNVLAFALNRISERSRRSRDFTLNALRVALREIVACFPVYRTYITPAGVDEADRNVIEAAILRARRENPAMEPSIFAFIRGVLLPFGNTGLSEEDVRLRLVFTSKFQQYTGPVHAKGVEDTAFYRFNLLASLNEVGGEPHKGGSTPAQFHEANLYRREHWPHAMLATATHDTKRGEDVRARLNVLSELPADWSKVVSRWARINVKHRKEVEGKPAPSRNDEYLFYQVLLGAWPAEAEGIAHDSADDDLVQRLRQYMTKATKEAKVHTSWINPNEAYDQAVADFVSGVLSGPGAKKFLAAFLPFQQRVARLGMVNSLAQVVLKLAAPGMPDFYQGTELWDLNLVDPDNRRPVDFNLRKQLLESCPEPAEPSAVGALLDQWTDGRIKMFITARGLKLRREHPDLFSEGDYLPLEVAGDQSAHVIAFVRRREDRILLAVAPRLFAALVGADCALPRGDEVWANTRLQLPAEFTDRAFRNIFTGEVVPVVKDGLSLGSLLSVCPVGLFWAE